MHRNIVKRRRRGRRRQLRKVIKITSFENYVRKEKGKIFKKKKQKEKDDEDEYDEEEILFYQFSPEIEGQEKLISEKLKSRGSRS